MFRNALILISAIGLAMPAAAQDKGSKLPENTIDCRQFKKSGPQEWIEVGTAVFDLGQITDINLTAQPVRPRSFKFGGIDLYPVLEGKCGAAAYFNQGKTDQAKGNVDSALANFNQAILLDPKNAEAFDLRGSLYAGKGDYARAIADYDEALRLDPKLESAASHKTGAQEALAKGSASNAPAEPQITLQEAGAVLKKGLDANGTASTPVQIPEQAHKDQALPKAEDKYASLAIPSQSGSCRAKKSIYVADGVADEKGVRSVIELVFENRQDGAVSGANSEFVIRESKNNQIQWTYKGKTVQKNNSGYLEFTPIQVRRKRPVVLALNYIKPSRDGSGEAILYLGGLHALFASEDLVRALKFEGERPAKPLPEVFYFDRCE